LEEIAGNTFLATHIPLFYTSITIFLQFLNEDSRVIITISCNYNGRSWSVGGYSIIYKPAWCIQLYYCCQM